MPKHVCPYPPQAGCYAFIACFGAILANTSSSIYSVKYAKIQWLRLFGVYTPHLLWVEKVSMILYGHIECLTLISIKTQAKVA